jgi:hypothetical protein
MCVGCKRNFVELTVSDEFVIGAACLKVLLRCIALFELRRPGLSDEHAE